MEHRNELQILNATEIPLGIVECYQTVTNYLFKLRET